MTDLLESDSVVIKRFARDVGTCMAKPCSENLGPTGHVRGHVFVFCIGPFEARLCREHLAKLAEQLQQHEQHEGAEQGPRCDWNDKQP